MRRAAFWLIALLSLLISGFGRFIGCIVGLFVAGLVAGYVWGWEIVNQPQPTMVIEEDED